MMSSDRPPAALSRYTGFLLVWMANRSRQRFFGALSEIDLHPRDFAVLTMIDDQPGSSQQQLTRATGVDASTMVALLDGLQERGLAERRPHPEDRRKRAIHLTAAGTEALAHARTRAAALDEENFGTLTGPERDELLRLMRKAVGA